MALEFDIRKYNPEDNTLVDGSDALANQRDQVISFQNIRNQESVFFKAFITAFSDTYSPNFNSVEVFGRTDPIQQYKGTNRSITLAFKVPAASESEAFENLGRAGKLIQMLYPSYASVSNALTLSEAPLVRLKVMNLLSKEHIYADSIDAFNKAMKADNTYEESYTIYKSEASPDEGILGAITSCTVNHGLESEGAFPKLDSTNTILPKLIEINVSFTPIHEETIGFEGEANNTPSFPYGVLLKDNKAKGQTPSAVLDEKRQLERELEEKRQAAATAQQEVDRQTAKAFRTLDKLGSFPDTKRGARQEKRTGKRAERRLVRLDDDQVKNYANSQTANTATADAATALSEFDFL